MWPNLTYDIGQPKVYFIQRDTSEFCVRPTPDQTYIFDILRYNFSSDLSGDTDTNWWTDYHWRVLLYGAMAEANEYVKNAQEAMYWRDKMEEEVKGIAHMETVETTQGDWPQLTAGAAFVV